MTRHPVVDELSLEEKAGLVSGGSFWGTRPVDRLAIETLVLTDGPHGVRMQSGGVDHLGINHSDPATCFPTASATGSCWDPDLLREMGTALAAEARAHGVDVLLGPGVNMKRHPLCGRNFEYLSEDPHLAGTLGAALVAGLEAGGVGASVKHFAANNQETDRMRVSAEVDERTLREIYLPAFETVVTTAAPSTVMSSYNLVNGVHAGEHRWLLTEVLRDEWGFDGVVVSDWGGVHDPVRSLAAGLDLEMPGTGEASPAAIVAAVRAGELDEALLDQAVSRLLTMRDRLHARRDHDQALDLDQHHALARRVAAESSVLLVNDGGLLPLAPTGGTVAVIGELARTPRYQGAGSSHVVPTRLDDALTAIRAATEREVAFAAGYLLEGDRDPALVAEAVAVASDADVVVLFLGLPDDDESEGFDRTHLDLPGAQRELVAAVAAANPAVVVVLSNGGVVCLEDVVGRVPAILETWLAGQAGGSAVADLLFGAAEPAGRLAETIPIALTDTPAYVNWPGADGRVLYGERHYIGYRWYDATRRAVRFPFGHGLGYTSFELSDLAVSVADLAVAHAVVEVTVTNTGGRAGAEVVQVYVGDPESSLDRPPRELKAFAKVRLEPSGSVRVRLELGERAFAFWGRDGWVVEPGEFLVEVGASSRDVRCEQVVELRVPEPVRPLDPESTVAEWDAHPVGSPVLRELLGEADLGDLSVEDVLTMAAGIPIRSLLQFRPDVDADAQLARMLAQVAERS